MVRFGWIVALAFCVSACSADEDCLASGCEEGYCDLGTLACETTVQITDAALRSCVHATLRQSGDVPADMAANLILLSCPDYGITNIAGLEAFTGLRELSLWENQIAEIGSIARLENLESVQLGNNHIGSLAPLADLAELSRLGVADNHLTTVTPIAGLAELEWLNIDNNQIHDVSPLVRLPNLAWLSAENNPLADDSPLDMLDEEGCEVYKRRTAPGAAELPSAAVDMSGAPELRVDGRGEVYFLVGGVPARREYGGSLRLEGEHLIYRLAGRSAVVGEVDGERWQLCAGPYADVCDFVIGRKAPNGAWAGAAAISVRLSLESAPAFQLPMASARVTLEPYALASPNQLDAGSCIFMANTGAMEILVHQRSPADPITYDGDTDFSERWLMNASDYVPRQDLPYAITDLVYAFNYFGGGLLNRDYPFTLGYVVETANGYARSSADDPDSYASAQYNWFDDLPTGWEDDVAPALEGDRTLVFVDPDLDSSSVWRVALMNDDVIERIKWELRSKMAPVIVVYNHYLYWHAVIVVGYDDFESEGDCPMVRDSMSYFDRQGASSYANAIRAHMEREGGCRERGVFYVRDSIYEGGSDEPPYDYGGVYNSRYSKRIVTHSYDWAKYLGNHAYTVQRR